MALNKVVIHNIIMFMRRDVVSKGDEAIAYCECMAALEKEINVVRDLGEQQVEKGDA